MLVDSLCDMGTLLAAGVFIRTNGERLFFVSTKIIVFLFLYRPKYWFSGFVL